MITISRTITNSTPGLKAASCGEHPGRRRVHRGKPIKCFKNRKTTTTQEVKFVYGKQFEKQSNPHTIYNTLAHSARSHVSKRWGLTSAHNQTQRQSRRRLTDAPATTHYGPASSAGRGRRRFHHHHIRRSCFVVTTRSALHGNRDNVSIYRGVR